MPKCSPPPRGTLPPSSPSTSVIGLAAEQGNVMQDLCRASTSERDRRRDKTASVRAFTSASPRRKS
eukprot:1196409-Prorocentrum_minimum.AAC.7